MIRLQYQRHSSPFHFGIPFNLADVEQFLFDLYKYIATEINVLHFTPFESKRELNLVAFLEEFAGVVDLDHQIMVTNFYGLEYQLFELAGF